MFVMPPPFVGKKPPYTCDAADFDGTNDYLNKASALVGLADGKRGLLGGWFRMDGGDGVENRILTLAVSGNSRFLVNRSATLNQFALVGRNASGTEILQLRTSGSFAAGGGWHHFMSSWDLADTAKRHLYIDDSPDMTVTTYTNDTIDYTGGIASARVGADPAAGAKFNGCLAELFFHPTYLDLSVESNRRKFINYALKPEDMGSNGQIPFGTTPLLYLRLAKGESASNFAINRGTGGSFDVIGALDTASSSPSD